jgi:thiol:disulfide interchange protein DsbC
MKSNGSIRQFARHVALLAIFGLVGTVAAEQPSSAPAASRVAKYPELEQNLKKELPETTIDDIEPTPIQGVFAVMSGRSVIYTDITGKYVINGHLFDATSKQDLTVDAIANRNRIDPRTLPLADSFQEVRGNGKRQLYVFSDPDCPFCKRLEHELPDLNDVTIHIFLFPIVQLHPDARTDAIAVWCSADREQSWEKQMIDGVKPAASVCDNPIDRNLALAGKLGINATPTLIFADGKMFPGALPAARINSLLDQAPSTN